MVPKPRAILFASILSVVTVVAPAGCDGNPGGPSAAGPSEKLEGDPPPPLEKSKGAPKVKEASTVAP